jgi:hypothetical protein
MKSTFSPHIYIGRLRTQNATRGQNCMVGLSARFVHYINNTSFMIDFSSLAMRSCSKRKPATFTALVNDQLGCGRPDNDLRVLHS